MSSSLAIIKLHLSPYSSISKITKIPLTLEEYEKFHNQTKVSSTLMGTKVKVFAFCGITFMLLTQDQRT